MIAGSAAAGADPKQFEDPLVGVGSDTTQDIMSAFTGEVNGRAFLPLQTGADTNRTQLASWRAVQITNGSSVQCIQPAGGILTDRPNGSGNGRAALSSAFAAAANRGWGRPDVTCTTNRANMSGLIDFARSSSGPGSATSGPLTYVPFARDALQFAYSAPSAALAVSNLTNGQVLALHATAGGPQSITVGGTRIIACRIQAGSGTYTSWGNVMFGGNAGGTSNFNAAAVTTLNSATSECAAAFDADQIGQNGVQEHDPQGLYDVCNRIRNGFTPVGGGAPVAAQPNTQCIIGYSVANWIAQFNGVGARSLNVDGAGTDAPPAANTGGAFNLGTRDGAGNASYDITAGTASPNAAYYAGTTYGRDVYNIIPTAAIGNPSFDATNQMFLCDGDDAGTDCDYDAFGATVNTPAASPAICSAAAATTRSLLGFGAPNEACGRYGAAINKRAFDTNCSGTVGSLETTGTCT